MSVPPRFGDLLYKYVPLLVDTKISREDIQDLNQGRTAGYKRLIDHDQHKKNKLMKQS